MDIVSDGITTMIFDSVNEQISTNGGLGADGYGARSRGSYAYSGWHAYWTQTHSAGNDPSVTHVWITNSATAIADTSVSDTNSDEDGVSDVDGCSLMYLLW